jgi:hypothetical protein
MHDRRHRPFWQKRYHPSSGIGGPARSHPRGSGAKRSNGATRARNVRRYGYSASRAPCHTVLLGAAPAVFQSRGGPSNPKSWHHKKSGAEHSIQRHSSSPTGLSGGCAKPIFDHAHERSAKRQGERGLILCPLSSNLPYRSRRVELRLQQRRKTEEAGFELSVPRDTTKVLKTPEVGEICTLAVEKRLTPTIAELANLRVKVAATWHRY